MIYIYTYICNLCMTAHIQTHITDPVICSPVFSGMPGIQAFHSALTKVKPNCHVLILTGQNYSKKYIFKISKLHWTQAKPRRIKKRPMECKRGKLLRGSWGENFLHPCSPPYFHTTMCLPRILKNSPVRQIQKKKVETHFFFQHHK